MRTREPCEIRARNRFNEPASLGLGRYRILLAELIDATAGIHNFLLARIERMTVRADFNLQILANGRAGLELIAAGASDRDDFVFWMDAGFHRNLGCRWRQNRRALRKVRIATPGVPRSVGTALNRPQRERADHIIRGLHSPQDP